MTDKNVQSSRQKVRKLAALVFAVLLYYTVHEGAHLLYAMLLGTFKRIRFLGLGIQIETYTDRMSPTQTAVFCMAGAAAALLAGWILLLLTKRILKSKSLLLRAVAFYSVLVFLINDPFYLSVLYPFVGGGDMNGIRLIIPEGYARALFGGLLIIHLFVIMTYLYPSYKKAFQELTRGQEQ